MSTRQAGNYRIIAGDWRGSRIPILDHTGLRPTPDRVRETLFNWLAPSLPGARCLDLFAGAGALGLEAASRGAAQVVMVDSARAVVLQLQETLLRLSASTVELVQSDAQVFLHGNATPFDVVFLDPPYDSDLLEPVLQLLAPNWVASGGLLYLEHSIREEPPRLPGSWEYIRGKRTSQVSYHLVHCAS